MVTYKHARIAYLASKIEQAEAMMIWRLEFEFPIDSPVYFFHHRTQDNPSAGVVVEHIGGSDAIMVIRTAGGKGRTFNVPARRVLSRKPKNRGRYET